VTAHAIAHASTGTSRRARDVGTALAYWVPTVLVALNSVSGGIYDALRAPAAMAVFDHLGYPAYFATLLGIAKVLGGLALLLPVPRVLREWAYAGLTFDVVAASVSILAVGDSVGHIAIPVFVLALIQLSYRGWRRRI